jgi:hypothetical protein
MVNAQMLDSIKMASEELADVMHARMFAHHSSTWQWEQYALYRGMLRELKDLCKEGALIDARELVIIMRDNFPVVYDALRREVRRVHQLTPA